ncbi:MAG TPA: RusA family crossover junction endodeoxyribonuclease [Trebonia sp.]
MTAVTRTLVVPSLSVWVPGRPAPQGSKELGEHGQMREASPYLPPWRQAIRRAVFERFRELGVKPADRPLYRGPVGISLMFHLDTGQRIDSAPDLDKLQRAVWDALTKAKVWEDDGRVVDVQAGKRQATDSLGTGAFLRIWPVIP